MCQDISAGRDRQGSRKPIGGSPVGEDRVGKYCDGEDRVGKYCDGTYRVRKYRAGKRGAAVVPRIPDLGVTYSVCPSNAGSQDPASGAG